MRPISAILVLGLATLTLAPQAGLAGISIGSSLTHERTVRTGETYEGSIPIINTGHQAEEAKIYQSDDRFYCEGTYHYDDPGTNPRSNAQWIDFSPRLVSVGPGASREISYTIEVPEDSSLSGTYWSLVMVEATGPAVPEVSSRSGQRIGLGISQVVRYGIQIVTHIGDTGQRRLEFLDTRILREKEARLAQIDIRNVGDRWLKPLVWMELYDRSGCLADRCEGGMLRIYPETSVRYVLDLSRVSPGEYKAVVIADCGGDDVFGVTYSVTLEHEDFFATR